jgi:hypothetical protein
VELRPLATLHLKTAADRLFMLGTTPAGNRIIQELQSAELDGERVKASMKGLVAADWLTISDRGLARVDIRLLLETVDNALIYLTYSGKADWSSGAAGSSIFVVAEFETADERYRWLNTIQAVGKGSVTADGGAVSYEFFELA